MNHVTTPTPESLRASDWFASYLREKCVDRNSTARLADAIGMERKQIYKYASGGCSPKLDTVAKILAYYGDFEKVTKAIGGAGLIPKKKEVEA